MADLMSIGEHCAEPSCRQVDFLPFTCDCCKRAYCLDHRTYASHRCVAAGQKEFTTIICPLCAKAIKLGANDDAMIIFDRHTETSCDPANYDRVHRKPRCPVPGCREKLTASNTYCCKECRVNVCLKHRFAKDHACAGKPVVLSSVAATRQRAADAMRSMLGNMSQRAGVSSPASTPQGQPVPPRPSPALADPANTLRGSAQRRQQGAVQSQQAAPARSAGVPQGAPPPAVPPGQSQQVVEVCLDCGAAFGSVVELIQHCETRHQVVDGGGIGTGRLERCPHCAAEFRDAVSLVEHVERAHAAANASTCVLC